MPVSTLDLEFKKYYSLLNKSQKESVIKMLKSFVQGGSDERQTIEEYNADIEQAMAEYKRGETLPHDAVEKLAKKW